MASLGFQDRLASSPVRLGRPAIDALGSSEELFRALTAHTPVGVFVSNADGKCIYVNDRWCELAGLAVEQALGDGWAVALHPDDFDRVLGEWAEASAGGRDSIVEYRFVRPDGGVSWIQGFATALRGGDGQVAGWVGTCLDLTARKEAEAAIVRESERFRAAFDGAPIGMALVSLDGRWLQVNDALCQLLGRSREQLLALSVADVTHPDDVGTEAHARSERRYVHADGEIVWVAVSTSLVRDPEGQPVYSVAQIENVSERLQAQRALCEAEERFRRAFDDAPIGMALVAPDGEFLRVNRPLCELTGYSESELLRRTFQDITHPDDLAADLDQVRRVLAGEIRAYQMEKRYRRSDDRLVWVMLSVSLVRDGEQRPLYFVAQIEDITTRKLAERELQHLADHDPLTGLLNRRRFNEELERELARARRYGGRAALLVIDVDRFKLVNDSLGHRAGDDVLRAVAETLRRRLRTTDVVCRIGGDEFAVLALSADGDDSARTIASDVADAIRSQTILTTGTAVEVTVSIGVAALDPATPAEADELFVAADNAMYRAKRAGRDRIALAA